MADQTSKTGMWIKISDAESARYAMRMSGLSAFWLGANGLLFALLTLMLSFGRGIDMVMLSILGGIGLVMVIVALLIRGGHFWLVPVTSVISAVLLVISLIYGSGYQAIVVLMALGLSIAGLRGWIWMRRKT